MPRHRSLNLKKFIDCVPKALLKEYFDKKREAGIEIPLNASDRDWILEFFEGETNGELQSSILEDFTHIHDICEKNMNTLVRAAARYQIPFSPNVEPHALAMELFLHHEDAFEYAYHYYCLFNSSSKLSRYNITAGDLRIMPQKIDRFQELVRDFYAGLAKGDECLVRHYAEGDQDTIVVVHGSYRRPVAVWDDDRKLNTIFIRRANEDVLQYDRKSSLLTLKAPYARDRENYIKAFAEAILEDESQIERPDLEATYTLKPLENGSFSYNGNETIRKIELLEVKIRIAGVTGSDVTINSTDVRDALEYDIRGVRLNSGDLRHAKLRFHLDIDGKQQKVTFEITPPNATDLVRKRYSDIIEAYLKVQGVKLV